MQPVSVIKIKGKVKGASAKKLAEYHENALRFFNGTQVLNFPCKKSFGDTGVYAIYCVSNKNMYRAYGESINRTAFNVPIYVGKALPKSNGFSSLPIEGQLDFWQRNFRTTINMSLQDFAVRIMPIEDESLVDVMVMRLVETHSPVWNQIFKSSYTLEREYEVWKLCHNVRFCRKSNTCEALKMRRQIETVLCV